MQRHVDVGILRNGDKDHEPAHAKQIGVEVEFGIEDEMEVAKEQEKIHKM